MTEESILRDTKTKLTIIKDALEQTQLQLKSGELTQKGIDNHAENLVLYSRGLELIILEIESVMGCKKALIIG